MWFSKGGEVMATTKDILDIELGPNQGVIAEINSSGDTKIIWARDNPMEVEIARAAFDKAKRSGFAAYTVEGKEGRKGRVIGEFDVEAERIILAPPMAGGF
jgi:hypothetical protein